jgi:hypothetical protein
MTKHYYYIDKMEKILEILPTIWFDNVSMLFSINGNTEYAGRRTISRCRKELRDQGLIDERGRYFRRKQNV